MRSKLFAGAMVTALGFLLVTNPTVVDAAGQITGKQIKDNSVTGKDVKDGSLAQGDLSAAAQAALKGNAGPAGPAGPQGTTQIKRLAGGPGATVARASSSTLSFYGPVATVSVAAGDVVSASATLHVFAGTAGDDLHYAVCYRPTGSASQPTVLGGQPAVMVDIDMQASDNAFAANGVDTPAAGTYDVGTCAAAYTGNGSDTTFLNTSGWVQVSKGTGSVGPASGARTAAQPHS